jgi:hypothetical protein
VSDDRISIVILVDPEDAAAIKALAKTIEVSRSELIRQWISDGLTGVESVAPWISRALDRARRLNRGGG